MWNNEELEQLEPVSVSLRDVLCSNFGLALAIAMPILIFALTEVL